MRSNCIGFVLLPLLLFCCINDGASVCSVPKEDQEFCTALHSICLTSPQKSCLAQSMTTCIEHSSMPVNIMHSLLEFFTQYLYPIVVPPFPPFPTLKPTDKPVTRIITYPPFITLAPVTEPVTEPPSTTRVPLPLITDLITPLYSVSSNGFAIVINTSNDYLDYLVSLLNSMESHTIKSVIAFMTHNYSLKLLPSPMTAINWQEITQEMEVLIYKLSYLIETYSNYQRDDQFIGRYVTQLIISNSHMYKWINTLVERIFIGLEITFPVIITTENPVKVSGQDMYETFTTTYQWRRDSVGMCHSDDPYGEKCERYCTDEYGGNWIGIHARERETEDQMNFDRGLSDYVAGFGDWNTGYWMGLECLYEITRGYPHELLIELSDASGVAAIAHYALFMVGDAGTNYQLGLGQYLGGAAGDSLRSSDGQMFTTYDQDLDNYKGGNCAVKHKGGWWYKNCQQLSVKNFLNGYFSSATEGEDIVSNFPHFGVRWNTWDTSFVITATRMFIRRSQTVLEYDH